MGTCSLYNNSRNETDLLGNLSKVVDEADGGRSLERVINGVDVDVAFIEEMMEHIDGFYSSWTLLFVAKYEINPFIEMSTDVVTLQSLHSPNIATTDSTTLHFYTKTESGFISESP